MDEPTHDSPRMPAWLRENLLVLWYALLIVFSVVFAPLQVARFIYAEF